MHTTSHDRFDVNEFSRNAAACRLSGLHKQLKPNAIFEKLVVFESLNEQIDEMVNGWRCYVY